MAKAQTLDEYMSAVKLKVKLRGGGNVYRAGSRIIRESFNQGASVDHAAKMVLTVCGVVS